MSCLLWARSRNTDKKRFIEIVARFGGGVPDSTRVSGVLLAEAVPQLRQQLGIAEKALHLSERNDKTEAEAISICTAAGIQDFKKRVRRYSYASLLYEEVRCGFAHEYKPGERAADGDQLRTLARVPSREISYTNALVIENAIPVTRRRIYFPLERISEIALAVADGMDNECANLNANPFDNLRVSIPTPWWSEG